VSAEEFFEKLKHELRNKTIEIDGELYYIAEGDIPFDEDQLRLYAMQRYALRKELEFRAERHSLGMGDVGAAQAGLTGILVNGKIVRWQEGTVLSYCVLQNTFGSTTEYETARGSMEAATREWEETCGVTFEHLVQHDRSPTTQVPEVLFTVRKIDSGGRFIAAAFFPNDPPSRRRVLIDPSFFDPALPFDRVGVLRHELGHVLGFRHEHIRSGAPPACPQEDTGDTIDLTQYDPRSVMHYFCGGVGSRDLAITDADRKGAQRVYGLPRGSFAFV
jgi:hypothetical protein